MSISTFTCPRCFFTASAETEMKYCPHCGLPDVQDAAMDRAPLDVVVDGRRYSVLERVAIGSVCNIYRCRFACGSLQVEGIFKIAADPRTNPMVLNEAEVLRRLCSVDAETRYTPFLPAVEASFGFDDGPGSQPRQANILRMHESIRSPDELYTLSEVRGAYPSGLDGRDVAWIWRRLLTVLGFAHTHGVVHGAVLPMHVLIEPREHKLLLIDWCAAQHDPQHNPRPLAIISGGHTSWYRREGASRTPPAPGLDVGLAARCMIDLLGGDALSGEFPSAVDPALQRHFKRCLGGTPGKRPDAWKLLDDFDRLIDALWGPRQFRELPMPPKRRN